MTSSSRIARIAWSALLLVCGLAFFWRLGGGGLFDLDEGLYVEAAREMRLSGDRVTPRVNGEPFFEKPPLIYWEAAGMFGLFGRSEFTARLPSALASTLLAALIFGFGARCFGRRAGLLAALFFTLSPLALAEARQLTTDATLDLCVSAALVCFFLSQESRVASREGAKPGLTTRDSRLTPLLVAGFWLFCGLGVLAKGAPGLLIPGAVAVVYLLIAGRFCAREAMRGIARLRPLAGLLLFLLVAAPWHVLAYRQGGQAFWSEYVVRQHIGRFRGGDTAHREPFWFYVPAFFLLAFPWSFLAVPAFLRRDPAGPEPPGEPPPARRARLFLKVWAALVFLMFSVSGSKLVSYILPMFPAAALLAGDWTAQALERREAGRALRAGLGAAFGVALLLFAVAALHAPVLRTIEELSRRPIRRGDVPLPLIVFAASLFGAAALATGAALALARKERRQAACGALLAGMGAVAGVAVLQGIPAIGRLFNRPLQSLAAEAGRQALATRTELALYTGSPRRPSALFYLPDALFQSPPVGGQHVFEAREEARAREFVARNPSALVLTTADRAPSLLAMPGVRPVERRGGWALLRKSVPGSAASACPRRARA